MGFDLARWMHWLKSFGVLLINPYEEGFDIKRDGKASSFNQFTALNASTLQETGAYISLLDKIDEIMGKLVGIPPQREGQMSSSELVGNVQRSILQSSYATEHIFVRHQQISRQVLTAILDTTRLAWADPETRPKNIDLILDDLSREWIETIPDKFFYVDYDIFISDSANDLRNIEYMKDIAKAGIIS